ncbi:hypothetical protein ACFWCA_19545 [Streptomyces phaeochromogenes]|uniref:hypothetical protein n=1 Tax=Streptomyces phaeochromogenes TaxID=1923 RepID=UPI0036AEF8D2
MATTRARKTAAPKSADAEAATQASTEATTETPADTAAGTATPAEEDTPAVVIDTTAPATDSTPKAPEAAPLEPPPVIEPPAAPAMPVYASPTEVIPDEHNLAEVIIDDATKEAPADVDAVFVPVTPYGSTLVCTVRLVERTFLGPHRNPVHRLLQPAGAQLSESVAARIRERLQEQAARLAGQDEK